MKAIRPRGADRGILRMRPGHLANFSGGAGYMPFILIESVPASFLFGIIGSLILHSKGRSVPSQDSEADEPLRRAALTDFVRYARRHVIVCVVLTIVLGSVLFFQGLSMVYGDKPDYLAVTLVFAAGPLAAWVMSTWLLVRLICRHGARASNLVLAGVTHVLLMIAFFLCIALFSALANVLV